MKKLVLSLALMLGAFAQIDLAAWAQVFTDPGFESYSVAAGGFVMPTTGPWIFVNNAGVVEPFAPNSATASDIWSATFTPIEGQQYVSTYAGLDAILQPVAFAAAGSYRLSVYAAAPGGSVTIPNQGTRTLTDGEFKFFVGNPLGTPISIAPGADWEQFTADFTIPHSGTYYAGVQNTKLASYFINYDNFAIGSVPEPSSIALWGLGIAIFAGRARFKYRKACVGRRTVA